MSAQSIAEVLGGSPSGNGWMACCPAHDDNSPSLSISEANNGKVLVNCLSGCNQDAVIAALRAKGLWSKRTRHRKTPTAHVGAENLDTASKSEQALSVWKNSKPATNTVVHTYLKSRGITAPTPESLRYHTALSHRDSGTYPAMIGLVTRGTDDAPLAIHRTFLAPDGSGKATVDPNKMMLGPCRGGAVRLGDPTDVLMIGEGIETCLSAMQATGYAAWAALSTSGLRILDLPPDIQNVIVLADADDAGEKAARAAGLRWKREGRSVRIARPPEGMDFNDVLLGLTPDANGSGK
jgi:putative DNA primase/helicase